MLLSTPSQSYLQATLYKNDNSNNSNNYSDFNGIVPSHFKDN